MRYVINKKTGYIYPFSETLLAKKDFEEIEEEKAKPKLKEQQRGDIGFREGGEVEAQKEAEAASEQAKVKQMEQEIAELKAMLEAQTKPSEAKPDSTINAEPAPAKNRGGRPKKE